MCLPNRETYFQPSQMRLDSFLSEGDVSQKVFDQDISWPKISVVTPSFNQARYLERTIRSVLNQNYPRLEYIIIDGGSTDKSVEIIKKYEKDLFYWVSEPDKGQSHSLEKGFDVSSGEIMAWLNSDDVYWPGALKNIGTFFLEHKEADVVYGDSFTIDEHDRILRETKSVRFNKWAFLTLSFSLHQASMFWRRSLYERSSGINRDLHLTMDRDLWFEFFQKGGRFKHIPETLSCYRAHRETKSAEYWIDLEKQVKEHVRERFHFDPDTVLNRVLRMIMRSRTLLLHILKGNLGYLFFSASKETMEAKK